MTTTSLFRRLLFLSAAMLLALATFTETPLGIASAQTPQPESRFAKFQGKRVHYVNYGLGNEALVLIHGWTQNADAWRDNISDFANRSRVIVIDLPGHGQSDKPTVVKGKAKQSGALYSMDYFARAVDAVMRHAKVTRAVLVGHSMGTPVARQFYRLFPDKTLGIVAVDGPLRAFLDKGTADGLIAGVRGPRFQDVVLQMLTGISGTNLSREARDRINASMMNTPQFVMVMAMEGMADPSIWGDDPIKVPVLATMAKTPLFPPNIEQTYRAVAPNMEFQMWDDVGHFLMMEKPKAFNAVVITWLDKNGLLKK